MTRKRRPRRTLGTAEQYAADQAEQWDWGSTVEEMAVRAERGPDGPPPPIFEQDPTPPAPLEGDPLAALSRWERGERPDPPAGFTRMQTYSTVEVPEPLWAAVTSLLAEIDTSPSAAQRQARTLGLLGAALRWWSASGNTDPVWPVVLGRPGRRR